MSLDLNRRQLLLAGGAAWLGAGAMARAMAPQPKGATKKVLFFTKSSGFQHSVIAEQGRQAVARRARSLTDIGKEHGFEVVASKDGRLFEPDQIGQWDVFVFETTGDLTTPGSDKNPPISADGEKAFYDAIRGGKGFMGMHCATDTFGHFGTAQQGGRRSLHPDDRRRVHRPRRPAGVQDRDRRPRVSRDQQRLRQGRKSFTIKDEWYALKNLPDDLHVILFQVTEGMKGNMYQRPNFPDDLGAGLRQGARLLHLDGPPRRRLGEPDVPGALARCPRVVVGPRRSQHRAEFPAGDAQGQRASQPELGASKAGRTACVVRGTS